MNFSKSISLLAVLLTGACAAKKNDAGSASLASASENWKRVFECQDQIHIDYDLNERRHLQVVVTDKSTFGLIDQNITYNQIRNDNERIYRGQGDKGVYSPSDFWTVFSYDPTTYTPTKGLGFEARRYGSNLVFRALDFIKTKCGGSLRGNDYTRCEVWNYTFNNCHEVN